MYKGSRSYNCIAQTHLPLLSQPDCSLDDF